MKERWKKMIEEGKSEEAVDEILEKMIKNKNISKDTKNLAKEILSISPVITMSHYQQNV